jgi:hypothetical protein
MTKLHDSTLPDRTAERDDEVTRFYATYLTELSKKLSTQRLLPNNVIIIVRLEGCLQVPALRYVRKAQQLLPFFAAQKRKEKSIKQR